VRSNWRVDSVIKNNHVNNALFVDRIETKQK
jgi:hypothetical protein